MCTNGCMYVQTTNEITVYIHRKGNRQFDTEIQRKTTVNNHITTITIIVTIVSL